MISSLIDWMNPANTRNTNTSTVRSKRGKSRQVFDVQMCLEALSRLPGLVLMGYVRPTQANTIRSTLETILRHHHQTGSTHTASPLQGIDIMSILRASAHDQPV